MENDTDITTTYVIEKNDNKGRLFTRLLINY